MITQNGQAIEPEWNALRMSGAFPGNRGLLCRYTLGESNDTLLVTWRKFIPEPLYKIEPDRWGWRILVQTDDPILGPYGDPQRGERV